MRIRRPSGLALATLRGRDADGRLRELLAHRARLRPRVAALAEGLRWGSPGDPVLDPGAVEDASPRALDHELSAAIAFLQRVDLELGRLPRQVVERRLHRELRRVRD